MEEHADMGVWGREAPLLERCAAGKGIAQLHR